MKLVLIIKRGVSLLIIVFFKDEMSPGLLFLRRGQAPVPKLTYDANILAEVSRRVFLSGFSSQFEFNFNRVKSCYL